MVKVTSLSSPFLRAHMMLLLQENRENEYDTCQKGCSQDDSPDGESLMQKVSAGFW